MGVDAARRQNRKPRLARPSTAPEKASQALLPAAMHTLAEDDQQEPLNINLDNLPPFELHPPPSSSPKASDAAAGYDWATFITLYACGRWDPHSTPRPPHASPSQEPAKEPVAPIPQGALAFEHTRPPPPPPSHRLRASFSAISSSSPSVSLSSIYPSLALPSDFPFPSSSYGPATAVPSTSTAFQSAATTPSYVATHLDAQTSAATLRWAGSRVRVAPLSLPSPEHELVDPMRGANAVPIPGSYPEFPTGPRPHPSYIATTDTHAKTASNPTGHGHSHSNSGQWHHNGAHTPGWDVMTPGGTRRSRLSGFWSGTADVEDPNYYRGHSMLPTIDASPATPDLESAAPASVPVHAMSAPGSVPVPPASDGVVNASINIPLAGPRPPPATAPVRVGAVADPTEGDYFGGAATVRRGRSSGLRTPPETREGSASGSQSPQYGSSSPKEPSEASGEQSPRKSRAPSPIEPVKPTTPDSNPARPALGRTTSSPPTSSTPILVDGSVSTPTPAAMSDHTRQDSPVFSSNSSLTHPSLEDARPLLTHASTLDNPSSYSVVSSVYSDAYAPLAMAHSVPAPAARRAALTRQTSAPLPMSKMALATLAPTTAHRRGPSSDPGREDERAGASSAGSAESVATNASKQKAPSDDRRTAKEDARSAREARAFAARGFLAPPYPPDELGRRRALYKFNIMNTGPDLNFDRIAHLAKLVFNTKGVLISVVDGEEQWFKSEWGVNKAYSCARASSFCGHTILQRGDEPMIVLDSRLDWRFAKSPLVLGPPNIRFYAGAPLRTHDGFNIGSLALIDDAPRDDFTPRQRHTLKEFAAIAMREMELWRDKIQLRIRDRIQNSMEQFSRECLEIDSEPQPHSHGSSKGGERPHESPPKFQEQPLLLTNIDQHKNVTSPPKNDVEQHQVPEHPALARDPPDLMGPSSSMDTVYDHAAKLVQRTLDVEGVVVMDVSHCEVLESMSAESTVSVVLHHGDPDVPTSTHTLSVEEYGRLNEFFARYPEGKIIEGIVPPMFRLFMQHAHIQYALVVPIYNVDKRPFALLCAWNASGQSKRFLEGHELSYLRAIGVIILSAVLKRRMMLADKAKSLFISNISHELRTPLHGILAAAELLGDSPLNHSQLSFLQTVQACGTSLVETVNHVLDFTKLSGNSKAGGVENVIVQTQVDLMQLVEEAVDGCWIGHRARTATMGDTGIGSVYSPPEDLSAAKQLVETVVEIGWRKRGWSLKCEKGGIRRVLMNVFGNSLKFTTNGYVHVILRELPRSGDEAANENETKVELVVLDTGKGISENFRKNQLFHPFSQENPLQTGTGLGLAIVNSIVKSESVNGKVDVWSEEGIGTEIKVTFTAQISGDETTAPEMEPFKFDDPIHPVTVSLIGFNVDHKGVQLVHDVVQTYLVSWWGFEIRPPDQGYGEIVILNEDVEPVKKATAERNTSRPFIILSMMRGNPSVMAIASEHERIGGFCRVIYKPGGPSRLHALLKLCLHAIKIGRSGASSPHGEEDGHEAQPVSAMAHVSRRNSEESNTWASTIRPLMSPRSSTAHPATSTSWRTLSSTAEKEEPPQVEAAEDADEVVPTVSIGVGGILLRSSVGTINSDERRFRVLVVEDNSILRNLLVKWLTTRGYDYRDAVDGRNGVSVYRDDGPFDVVLLDMSMPVLDGIGATTEIRQMEAERLVDDAHGTPTRILALTGMSSLEDKRRAFEAGVDGYLVKPVAFKTLDEMFSKLGVS
ncbi:hypothetical protein C8R43DRAFT_1045557 [Mycena crocata]|nr:hypothetical protein C8R43DRAFT_1045557 [Mycena crocata]